MRLRVHCDEMAYGGAAEMAAHLGVDAVDHCNYIRKYDVHAIAERGIVTVACPATIAYLDLPARAPVRELLEAGGMVALASDYNPGTSPCFNLQTVAYFGRKLFGLSAPEALYAVTRAAAHSLRVRCRANSRWSAAADFVALRIESPDEFGWQFGGNLAALVVKRHASLSLRSKADATMTSELVRCARALVSGELREDYAFVVRDGKIVAAGDFRDVRAAARNLERAFLPRRPARGTGLHQRAQPCVSDLAARLGRRLALCKMAKRRALSRRTAAHAEDVYWTFVAAFSEMLAAGITTVAEFFYLNGTGERARRSGDSSGDATRAFGSCSPEPGWTRRTRRRSFERASRSPPNAPSSSCDAFPRQTSASLRIRCTPRRAR